MPHPYPVASVFTEGMRRDVDRAMLPGGAVWNLVDFIPDELAAAASGRGGWTYSGPAMTAVTQITAIGYHPVAKKVVGCDSRSPSHLWDVIAGTDLGFSDLPPAVSPPWYHRELLLFPCGSGAQYYDGATVADLNFPYNIWFGTAYKDHSVVAQTNNERVYFSAAGDPTTWDTNFGWWDTTGHVTGLAAT
jgi:hypothetical protein